MIGVATAIIGGAQGIGFAIPVDRAKRIVDDLVRFGHVQAVWIGVRGRTITGRGRGGSPARVPGPQRRAGLSRGAGRRRAGDQIVSVDATPIDSRGVLRDGALDPRSRPADEDRARRGAGAERTVTLPGQAPPADYGVRLCATSSASPSARCAARTAHHRRGSSGAAARAGLETGDALLALNGTRGRTSTTSTRFSSATTAARRSGWSSAAALAVHADVSAELNRVSPHSEAGRQPLQDAGRSCSVGRPQLSEGRPIELSSASALDTTIPASTRAAAPTSRQPFVRSQAASSAAHDRLEREDDRGVGRRHAPLRPRPAEEGADGPDRAEVERRCPRKVPPQTTGRTSRAAAGGRQDAAIQRERQHRRDEP